MSSFEKYQYSVIDVCDALHGAITGSGDGMSDKEFRQLVEWLEWRITKGWEDRAYKNAVVRARYDYDSAVKHMARAVLDMVVDYLET